MSDSTADSAPGNGGLSEDLRQRNSSGQDKPGLLGETLRENGAFSYLRGWLASFKTDAATAAVPKPSPSVPKESPPDAEHAQHPSEESGRAATTDQAHCTGCADAQAHPDPIRIVENPDPDREERQLKWQEIGWDVFERKALLIAAAKDLQDNGCSNPVKLAAADVFVEKAQKLLTSRADKLYDWGVRTAVAAVVLMVVIAGLLTFWPAKWVLSVSTAKEEVTNAYLAVVILKATTAGGFFAGIVYFLVSLSRAFFHEGTVLFSRRHSLRFGRLFVYLMSDSMKREDLEAVFNWNAEFSTAFRDIRADGIAKSPLLKMIEALSPTESLKVLHEMMKSAKSSAGEDNKKPG